MATSAAARDAYTLLERDSPVDLATDFKLIVCRYKSVKLSDMAPANGAQTDSRKYSAVSAVNAVEFEPVLAREGTSGTWCPIPANTVRIRWQSWYKG